QDENAGGTISPLAKRIAPGANPAKRTLFRKSWPGSVEKMIRSSVPLLPPIPLQPLIVNIPPVRTPPEKVKRPWLGGLLVLGGGSRLIIELAARVKVPN